MAKISVYVCTTVNFIGYVWTIRRHRDCDTANISFSTSLIASVIVAVRAITGVLGKGMNLMESCVDGPESISPTKRKCVERNDQQPTVFIASCIRIIIIAYHLDPQ